QGTILSQALGTLLLSQYPDSELGLTLVEASLGAQIRTMAASGAARAQELNDEQLRQVEEKINEEILPALTVSDRLRNVRFEMEKARGKGYRFRLAYAYRVSAEDKVLEFSYDPLSGKAARIAKNAGRESGAPGMTPTHFPGKGLPVPPRLPGVMGALEKLRTALNERMEIQQGIRLWNLYDDSLLAFSRRTVKKLVAKYPVKDAQDLNLDRAVELVLNSREFRRMAYVSQGILSASHDTPQRMQHIIDVAKISARLAGRMGMNVRLAVLLAILHDLGHPVLGHIAEKANNYSTNSEFSHSYNHNVEGAVITDNLLEGKVPDPLLSLLKAGVLEHSDKSMRVEVKSGKHGSAEGALLMFSDAISSINTDLRLGMKYEYFTREQLVAAVPEVREFGDYPVDELAERITAHLIDDVVQNSSRDSIGFSPAVEPLFRKVKDFLLKDYIGKKDEKINSEMWKNSLVKVLREMPVEDQIIFLRTTRDQELFELFRNKNIPVPQNIITEYGTHGRWAKGGEQFARLLMLASRGFHLMTAVLTKAAFDAAVWTITVFERFLARLAATAPWVRGMIEVTADWHTRALRNDIVTAQALRTQRMKLARTLEGRSSAKDSRITSDSAMNFAIEAIRTADKNPQYLEKLTVLLLEDFLGRPEIDENTHITLGNAFQEIAKSPCWRSRWKTRCTMKRTAFP
ncbi:MAG: HD domain-containing protein, partial [Endomicrobiales bacterium]